MKLSAFAVTAILFIASTNANSALVERLGGLAYYDDVADLTWLTNTSLAGVFMGWADSNNWAANLEVDGITGWRLANTLQPDLSCSSQGNGVSSGFNCTGSEMGNLFYNVLGNTAGSLTNTGPFTNVQNYYWTATESASNAAWRFGLTSNSGLTSNEIKSTRYYAWAVHTGDVGVSAVPVPAAVWLFGSGLVGLVGFARRKKV